MRLPKAVPKFIRGYVGLFDWLSGATYSNKENPTTVLYEDGSPKASLKKKSKRAFAGLYSYKLYMYNK